VTLTVEITLPKDVHVYAPGAQGYKPIALQLNSTTEVKFDHVPYPSSHILFLRAINEKMPVFSGRFGITQDVTVSVAPEFIRSLHSNRKTGRPIELNGTFVLSSLRRHKAFPARKGSSFVAAYSRAARFAKSVGEHSTSGDP
jgi:hypothetical protein